MIGDWRVLKLHRLRELEFPSGKDFAICPGVSWVDLSGAGDDKPAALRPWEGVRTPKVERARQLIRDPEYPSKKVLDAVADLIAGEIVSKKRPRKK